MPVILKWTSTCDRSAAMRSPNSTRNTRARTRICPSSPSARSSMRSIAASAPTRADGHHECRQLVVASVEHLDGVVAHRPAVALAELAGPRCPGLAEVDILRHCARRVAHLQAGAG